MPLRMFLVTKKQVVTVLNPPLSKLFPRTRDRGIEGCGRRVRGDESDAKQRGFIVPRISVIRDKACLGAMSNIELQVHLGLALSTCDNVPFYMNRLG